MSTPAEIQKVYKQDVRRPYYSIQNGQSIKHIPRKSNKTWIWGHWRRALEQALNELRAVKKIP